MRLGPRLQHPMGTFPPALTLQEALGAEPAAVFGGLVARIFGYVFTSAREIGHSEAYVSFVGQLEVRTQALNDQGCLEGSQLDFIEKRLNESLRLSGSLAIRKLETIEVYIAGLEATCARGIGPLGGAFLGAGVSALVLAGVAAGLWWWMGQS